MKNVTFCQRHQTWEIYIYIYQIESLREMSWYLPISMLGDDRGERNDHLKPQPVPPLCSCHFPESHFSPPTGSRSSLIGQLNHSLYALEEPWTVVGWPRKAAWPSHSSPQSHGCLAWVPRFWDLSSLLSLCVCLLEPPLLKNDCCREARERSLERDRDTEKRERENIWEGEK